MLRTDKYVKDQNETKAKTGTQNKLMKNAMNDGAIAVLHIFTFLRIHREMTTKKQEKEQNSLNPNDRS